MPTVFFEAGYRFFFYSNEGSPLEPVHIHVERDAAEAKFWIRPEITVAYNYGYSARSLRTLAEIVAKNSDLIEQGME